MPVIDELKTEPTDGAPPEEEAANPVSEAEPPNIPPASLLNPLPLEIEEDDDEEDETLAERLMGLGEMFPERVRSVTSNMVSFSWNGAKWLYSAGRVGAWVVASSAVILALPVMFETERAQMEEQQLQQQRQILLGPNAAVSGAGHSGLMPGAMPQVVPPPAR